MSTLSWGASLDRLLVETPVKEEPVYMETKARDLRNILIELFGQGHKLDTEDGRAAILTRMWDWLMELQGCSVPPMRGGGDAFAAQVMLWFDSSGRVSTAAKHRDEQQKILDAKEKQAAAAVAKALANVAQQAVSSSADNDAKEKLTKALAERMSAWKATQLMQVQKNAAAAEEQLQAALEVLRTQAMELAAHVQSECASSAPLSEDALVALMMKEVEAEMRQLDLADKPTGGAAETGGTLEETVCDKAPEQPSGLQGLKKS